jgi:hypothetical protein
MTIQKSTGNVVALPELVLLETDAAVAARLCTAIPERGRVLLESRSAGLAGCPSRGVLTASTGLLSDSTSLPFVCEQVRSRAPLLRWPATGVADRGGASRR